mmetsp:Transcript_8636/g.29068  ORF Transcript_8636/g.29068 Transcript_8636/m.29068 type:complete len:161 (-) Transcript_8636:4127-4609(-)
MTMVKYEHDIVTREFNDRAYDVRRVIVRRQRSFVNMLAVPHRSGTRAEHVCTEHHRHFCHHKRDSIHIDPALRLSASLKTINTSTFNATGRPGRVRLARTIRIYTRRLEHTGAPARTHVSSTGCACVCAHRPVFPYGYLVCVHSYKYRSDSFKYRRFSFK